MARVTGFAIWIFRYLLPHQPISKDELHQQLLSAIVNTSIDEALDEIEQLNKQLIDQSWKSRWKSPDDSTVHWKVTPSDLGIITHHAQHSTSPPMNAVILRKMVTLSHPRYIMELGTSTGVSSAYMSLDTGAQIDTIEQSLPLYNIAQRMHQKLNLDKIHPHLGQFDEVFKQLLISGTRYDLIFIDGDHYLESTLRYFTTLLPYCTENALIVVDDIYWSYGMTRAWRQLKRHPNAQWTIDLYHFGIIRLGSDDSSQVIHSYQIPQHWRHWLLRRRRR